MLLLLLTECACKRKQVWLQAKGAQKQMPLERHAIMLAAGKGEAKSKEQKSAFACQAMSLVITTKLQIN